MHHLNSWVHTGLITVWIPSVRSTGAERTMTEGPGEVYRVTNKVSLGRWHWWACAGERRKMNLALIPESACFVYLRSCSLGIACHTGYWGPYILQCFWHLRVDCYQQQAARTWRETRNGLWSCISMGTVVLVHCFLYPHPHFLSTTRGTVLFCHTFLSPSCYGQAQVEPNWIFWNTN